MDELSSGGWTAVVAAGDRPGADEMAAYFNEPSKALIPVGGESMLSRVVRTLLSSRKISRVVILAQDWRPLVGKPDTKWLAGHARVTFERSQAGLSQSIAAVAGSSAAPWPVLLTTADHPLLTPDIIEAFLEQTAGADLIIGMVRRRTLLPRFKQSKRTWLKFGDGHFTGANLFAFCGDAVSPALALWADVEQRRKSPFAIYSRFGPWLLFRALTRTISLEVGIKSAGRKIGVKAKPVMLPFAEAAIDVDKMADHRLAEAVLAGEA